MRSISAVLKTILVILALIFGLIPYQQSVAATPWLYLRADSLPSASEKLVELVVVGDIMLGRSVRADAQTLAQVAPWLSAADLAIGNLEGVIAPASCVNSCDMGLQSASVEEVYGPYRLIMPEQVPEWLGQAGFDLLGLANNHTLDMRQSGLSSMMAALQSAGLQVFGTVSQPGISPQPLIVERNGVKLAFLGFSEIPTPQYPTEGPAPARYNPQLAQQSIQQARQQADVVIVSIHWGVEYQRYTDAAQQRIARELFTAGADLVVGHHPHVVQPTEWIPADKLERLPTNREKADPVIPEPPRDHFVAYSLGNFAFDQFEGETRYGLGLRVYLDQDGLRAVQALPLQATPHPRWLEPAEPAPFLERISASERILPSLELNQAAEAPHSIRGLFDGEDGIFEWGEIDLTGDGWPEQVRLQQGQAEIYQNGQVAWASPPEWQVLDLTLGDPNDDGRYELLLSLRKPDRQGELRSHPFIVGYRTGMYKLLWGGSALSTPINQVELFDLDDNGTQELLVVEEFPSDLQTVSAWRWHGWGYTLLWREALVEANASLIWVRNLPGGSQVAR
jgi:poly-gamma-glutamate synthesis protein (capsule biosynthesis protein)